MDLFNKLPTIYKAVAAFLALLVPLLTSIIAAASDGSVTGAEWWTIGMAAAALIGGTKAVHKVTNRPI